MFYFTDVGDGDDKSVNTLDDLDIYGEYGVSIIRKECLSHVQKRIRMHLIVNQKEYINSQKIMMQHELAVAKNDVEKKAIRKKYTPFMFRDSKLGSDCRDDPEFDYCTPQIELLSDSMIDKITSLYGYTIKANIDCSLLELRNYF